MCKVSNNIKFCTCTDAADIKSLKNYWVLLRKSPSKNQVLGECIIPTIYRDKNYRENSAAIEQAINSGDAFDKPLNFLREDRIELVLSVNNIQEEAFIYVFEFDGIRWFQIEEETFELINKYKEENAGEVKLKQSGFGG